MSDKVGRWRGKGGGEVGGIPVPRFKIKWQKSSKSMNNAECRPRPNVAEQGKDLKRSNDYDRETDSSLFEHNNDEMTSK